jgi:hypothetical protein
LKPFVATRCVACQIQAEVSSSSQLTKLEEKIAALERDNLELQKACSAKDAQLFTSRTEANTTLEVKNRYSKELATT